MSDIILRDATENDLDAILDLWEALIALHAELDPIFTPARDGRRRYRDWLIEHMASGNAFLVVTELDERVVGYCLATIQQLAPTVDFWLIGLISDMCIADAHRNLGLGRRLYTEIERRFIARGITRLEVKTSSFNAQSNHFWEEVCGFREFMRAHAKKIGAATDEDSRE